MKKALVLAMALSLAGFASQAQSSAAKPATAAVKVAGPQIKFEEDKFDFGSIKQNDVVDHTFKFKNVGNQPLVISNIGVTCGCTTPDWTKDPIMPGKSGVVTAKFNSAGKMGQQNKVLTIESNSASGNAMVSLVGTVTEAGASASAAPASMNNSFSDASKEKVKASDAKLKEKRKS